MRLVDINRPAAYVALVPAIAKIARQFGYAAAIHGSMASDLDIVLVPWVEDAAPANDVVEAIRLFVGGRKRKCDVQPFEKPLGRLSWTFYFTENGVNGYGTTEPYLDISVTPRGCHRRGGTSEADQDR